MSEFCPPAPGACASCATEPAEAFVSHVVLSLLGFRLKYCGVWCKMGIRYHTSYCKYILFCIYDTKNTDRVSFGIGMVITEKYRPIPTKKYQLYMQL